MKAVFLDTETTGLNPLKHSIHEIAFTIVDLSSGEVLTEYETIIRLSKEQWEQSSPVSIRFTGITWEEVANGKPPETVREEILATFQKHNIVRGRAVFICHNPSFDRNFFNGLIAVDIQEQNKLPYYWLDFASMYFAKMKFEGKDVSKISLSKDAIALKHKILAEKVPHKAKNGVDHLLLCYETVIGFS